MILAINGGSSTVKCGLFTADAEPEEIARGNVEGTGGACVPRLLTWIDGHAGGRPIAAIGHRLVHGGPAHAQPVRVTAAVLRDLAALIPFAPNHLPPEISLIERFGQHYPNVPQFACFDTAFHASMPEVARRLPIPAEFVARGIRKYGFHGLSYAYLIEQLRRVAGDIAANGRVILAHLGNGSSLAAVHGGRSVDTTMGLTPIGGVVMSTRSGDLDPGVVTYLGRTESLSPEALEDLLSHRSGLFAISGGTSDMRTLLERETHDEASRLAVEMYVYSLRKAAGALVAALGGIDTIVFSGGIGEHAPLIRERVADGLAWLGVSLDAERNGTNAPVISAAESGVVVRVMPTDEELMIARAARRLLDA